MAGVIFIHGFNKTPDTWNKTESGKDILIEKLVSKKAHTLLVHIDDYDSNPSETVVPIIDQIKLVGLKKWTVVCHSLGVIYGLELLKSDIPITGVCLIDPTVPDAKFISKLEKEGRHVLKSYCKDHTQLDFPPKIIFHIHFDYDMRKPEKLSRKVQYYNGLTTKNDKSEIIIHMNKGHMLHYTDGPKIVNSIMNLIRL